VFYDVIAVARDWSILILALPALAALGVSAYLLWHLLHTVRAFVPQVGLALRRISDRVTRVARTIEEVRRRVETPLIQLRVLPAQVTAFWRAWRGGGRRR